MRLCFMRMESDDYVILIVYMVTSLWMVFVNQLLIDHVEDIRNIISVRLEQEMRMISMRRPDDGSGAVNEPQAEEMLLVLNVEPDIV